VITTVKATEYEANLRKEHDASRAIDVDTPLVVMNRTSVLASGALSGRRTTALTTEKIAVLAPMPSVSVRTQASAKPG